MNKLVKAAVAIFAFTASINIACATTSNENTPKNMTCREFIDMNPKAMTPVAFWVINKDTNFAGGDYVDWDEVDTTSVPLLIKVCKANPQSRIEKWVDSIR